MKFCNHSLSLAAALAVALSICSTAHANRLANKPVVFASALVTIDSSSPDSVSPDSVSPDSLSDNADQHQADGDQTNDMGVQNAVAKDAVTKDAVTKDNNAWEWDATKGELASGLETQDFVFDTELPSSDGVQVPEPSTLLLGALAGLCTLFHRFHRKK